MTKAKQKEKTLELIGSYINRLPMALDRPALEYTDDIITGMLRLAYKLEIITKAELDEIDTRQTIAYCDHRRTLAAQEGAPAA